ncbi:hypothetical protein A6A27_13315 [Micromonospora sp. CB01531]|nr:hypothetical protein A6A27_13315 [Micromonospora sp. CB01531]
MCRGLSFTIQPSRLQRFELIDPTHYLSCGIALTRDPPQRYVFRFAFEAERIRCFVGLVRVSCFRDLHSNDFIDPIEDRFAANSNCWPRPIR